MALDHLGIFHSKVASGLRAVFGRLITTLLPVALTQPPASTRLDRAVDHRRAMGPPPVSRARWSVPSNQRGDMTQLYLPSKSRFWGWGMVCWFQGWLRSTGLPSGSLVTNISCPSQLS